MNNSFEASFNSIFRDSLDNASEAVQAEYGSWADGYDACSNGLPCPPGASESFLAGYGRYYEEEQRG